MTNLPANYASKFRVAQLDERLLNERAGLLVCCGVCSPGSLPSYTDRVLGAAALI
jgi:hypothetical protein